MQHKTWAAAPTGVRTPDAMRFAVGMIPSLEGVHPSALITLVGQDRQILTVRALASPNYSGVLDAFRYSPVLQGGIHPETAL